MEISLIILLIGTSGAGKSTLRDYVVNNSKHMKKLLAVTDRPLRKHETNGVDKCFVSSKDFKKLNDLGELCFVNEVYGHMYGFKRENFLNGEQYLGELYYKNLESFLSFHRNTITIYVKPSKIENAVAGLYSRGSESKEILIRKKEILKEMEELDNLSLQQKFNYTFINEYTDNSKLEFMKIVSEMINKRKVDINYGN